MKISIIIPTYNSAQYLPKAIESVLSQEYPDKELIVIDGNSSDATRALLESYGDKFTWISEPDKGQSDAINKGFKMAMGEIVAWLNADDYYEPNILGNIATAFNEHTDSTIIYGKCYSVFSDHTIDNIPPRSITRTELLRRGNLIFQPASFYRRSAVEKVGYLDSSYYFWMEYDLYIKLLEIGHAYFIDTFLANFTVHENQKSNSKNIIRMDKELRAINRKHGGPLLSRLLLQEWRHRLFGFKV